MFTGIITALGQLKTRQPLGGDVRLQIFSRDLDLGEVHQGDSIAVNGVCLTVVAFERDHFWVDASNETLRRTTLGQLPLNGRVNLEKALLPTTRLGGHLVSGHVDGLGQIVSIQQDARSWQYHIKAPAELKRYIAEKGSICVDGVSLTVNRVVDEVFELNIIPHTFAVTIFEDYRVATWVNLEVDLVARYLERLLMSRAASTDDESLKSLMKKTGFMS